MRSGGGAAAAAVTATGGGIFEGGDVELVSPAAQVSLGVRSGGEGWGLGTVVEETVEYGEGLGEDQVAAEVRREEEDPFVMEEEDLEWPEYPWWPVLADAIETALRSMTLDELNDRMAVRDILRANKKWRTRKKKRQQLQKCSSFFFR